MKDCVRGHGKLVVAVFAVDEFGAVRQPRRIRVAAARADRAIWPTKPLKQFAAGRVRREGCAKLYDRHRETSNG